MNFLDHPNFFNHSPAHLERAYFQPDSPRQFQLGSLFPLEKKDGSIPDSIVCVAHLDGLLLFQQCFTKRRINWSAFRGLTFSPHMLWGRLNFTNSQKSIEVVPTDSVSWTNAVTDIYGPQFTTTNPAED